MESKKGNKSVTEKLKSRARHQCPDGLNRLIDLANEPDADQSGDGFALGIDGKRVVLTRGELISTMLRSIARSIAGVDVAITITISLKPDRDSWIKFADVEIFQLPTGIEFDARRVRECAICDRIFWAKQDNMVACSSRCSTANRQRRLRERRDGYEKARSKKARKKP